MNRSLGLVLLVCACMGGIAEVQAPLAKRLTKVKARDDVYALPRPSTIKAMSLGYDAAGADLLWVKLLLEYGSHWSERKYFHEAPLFIDAIIELDPHHRALYTFVDSILIYQSTETNTSHGDLESARAARQYLEKGLEQFPYDGELWLHYGQFIAFMGPAYVTDKDEVERWRFDGAKAIGRAMELGIRVDRTMSAAAVLGRSGEAKAAIAFLRNAYALSDSEEERQDILGRLATYQDAAAEDERVRTLRTVETTWRGTFPYMTRERFLLLSPSPNPAMCAGRAASGRLDCLTSWASVSSELER
jgi:hypothetical protein